MTSPTLTEPAALAADPVTVDRVTIENLPDHVRFHLTRAADVLRRADTADPRELADLLYASWYTSPPSAVLDREATAPQRLDLRAAFPAAHALAGRLEDGWVVLAAGPRGTLTAQRDGAVRALRPGEYVNAARPGVPPAPGDVVRAVARLDTLDVERHLWWTFTAQRPAGPLGRIYLDARPDTAARTLAVVTAALDAVGVRYQLKCSVVAVLSERVDAVVLYHERSDRDAVLATLLARRDELAPLLDRATPPLTCPVAPGLAWADDDGDPDRSFGERRCAALARAVPLSGRGDLDVTALARALLADGIDPSQPWLAAR